MSCLTRITNYYPQLTASERKIADYLTNNPESAVKLNINELAKVIPCAPSSITKFVKKLDYRSFSDMRLELMRNVDSSSAADFSQFLGWSGSPDSISQYYMQGITRTLQATLEINEFDKFTKHAQMIADAHTVYLFGVGNSSIIAQDMMQKLIRLNKRCIFCLDGNFGVQNSMLATPEDVALAISYGGDTDEVNIAARRIREAKCPLIAFTRCAKTPLSSMADLNLQVPNIEQVTRIASLFSRYSFLFLVDIVYLKYAQIAGFDSNAILREYRELHKPLVEG